MPSRTMLPANLGLLSMAAALAVLSAAPLSSARNSVATPVLPAAVAARALTPLSDQPWDRLIAPPWNYLKRSRSADAAIVVDATAPYSAPSVLQISFTPDLEHDRQPTVHWMGLPFVRELYATWWLKLSPNWKASPAGAGKMTFLWPPQGNGVMYSALGGSSAPHHVTIATTWPAYGYKFWEPNVARTDVYYDRWYRVQWYVNWETTPGAGDGIIRWWVDDVLNGEYTTVTFPACCLLQFEFAPTLQLPPPSTQFMYIDHTWVAVP